MMKLGQIKSGSRQKLGNAKNVGVITKTMKRIVSSWLTKMARKRDV